MLCCAYHCNTHKKNPVARQFNRCFLAIVLHYSPYEEVFNVCVCVRQWPRILFACSDGDLIVCRNEERIVSLLLSPTQHKVTYPAVLSSVVSRMLLAPRCRTPVRNARMCRLEPIAVKTQHQCYHHFSEHETHRLAVPSVSPAK